MYASTHTLRLCSQIILAAWTILCVTGTARAQVTPASSPLLSPFLDTQVDGWHTLKRHQIYLILTASGAGTDVLAVAPPQTEPTKLAQALQGALKGTSLQRQTVEWQSDDWTVAHARQSAGHFGTGEAVNVIPLARIIAGFKNVGFDPLIALRVPHVAFAARMPAPFFVDDVEDWYDAGGRTAPPVLRVRDWVSTSDLFVLLLPFLGLPLLARTGGTLVARRAQGWEKSRQMRKRFEALAGLPLALGWMGWMVWQISRIGQRSPLEAVADVWFGIIPNASDTLYMGYFISVVLYVGLCSLAIQRQTMRLFGPSQTVPVSAMTTAERTFRERNVLWGGALPLLAAGSAFLVIALRPGLVPPAFGRAVYPLLLLLIGVPSALYAHRKAQVFTQQVPDADLTDLARTVEAQFGSPAPEVMVERSSRASEFAFLESRRGGRIIVSQKLAEIAATDEMSFLIAHQVVLGKILDPNKVFMPLVLSLFLALIAGLALTPRWVHAHMQNNQMAAMCAALLVFVTVLSVVFWLVGSVVPRMERARLLEADRDALALTKNLTAATQSLEILRRYAAPPKGPGNPQGMLARQIAARLSALTPERTA